MVNQWIAVNALTIQERRKIREGIDMNMSYSQIGIHVGRCKSVVMRESKRFGKASKYNPELAQEDFERKQKLIGKKVKR